VSRSRLPASLALLAPAFVLLVLGLVVPGGVLLYDVLFGRQLTGAQGIGPALDRFVSGPALEALGRTLALALATATVAVGVAYPVAYYLYSRRARRNVVILCLFAPLFVSVVVRSYAWILVLVPRTGVISLVPFASDARLLFTEWAVLIGLVHILLPVAGLALYASLANVRIEVLRAAQSLGASFPRVVVDVLLPLTAVGITNAFTLVFVLSATAVAIPVLLGGVGANTIGYQIWQQFLIYGDYVYGSVLTFILVVSTLAVVAAVSAASRRLAPATAL